MSLYIYISSYIWNQDVQPFSMFSVRSGKMGRVINNHMCVNLQAALLIKVQHSGNTTGVYVLSRNLWRYTLRASYHSALTVWKVFYLKLCDILSC